MKTGRESTNILAFAAKIPESLRTVVKNKYAQLAFFVLVGGLKSCNQHDGKDIFSGNPDAPICTKDAIIFPANMDTVAWKQHIDDGYLPANSIEKSVFTENGQRKYMFTLADSAYIEANMPLDVQMVVLRDQGYTYHDEQQYEKSLISFEKMEKIALDLEDGPMMVKAIVRQVNILYLMGDRAEALRRMEIAEKYADEYMMEHGQTGEKYQILRIAMHEGYETIGNTLRKLAYGYDGENRVRRMDNAVLYYEKSIDLYKKADRIPQNFSETPEATNTQKIDFWAARVYGDIAKSYTYRAIALENTGAEESVYKSIVQMNRALHIGKSAIENSNNIIENTETSEAVSQIYERFQVVREESADDVDKRVQMYRESKYKKQVENYIQKKEGETDLLSPEIKKMLNGQDANTLDQKTEEKIQADVNHLMQEKKGECYKVVLAERLTSIRSFMITRKSFQIYNHILLKNYTQAEALIQEADKEIQDMDLSSDDLGRVYYLKALYCHKIFETTGDLQMKKKASAYYTKAENYIDGSEDKNQTDVQLLYLELKMCDLWLDMGWNMEEHGGVGGVVSPSYDELLTVAEKIQKQELRDIQQMQKLASIAEMLLLKKNMRQETNANISETYLDQRKKQDIQEEKAERSRQITFVVLGFLILAVGSTIMILQQYKKSRKQGHIIEETNLELIKLNKNLEHKQAELEKSNKALHKAQEKIEQSLRMARHQQEKSIPRRKLENFFAEHALLFAPKDYVSGDFVSVEDLGEKLLVMVGDSTGHGVPGAMIGEMARTGVKEVVGQLKQGVGDENMLMQIEKIQNTIKILAQSLGEDADGLVEVENTIEDLHNMLQKEDLLHPEIIAEQLRERVKDYRKGAEEKDELKHGFDMAMCIIPKKPILNEDGEKVFLVEFSGAFNPVLHMKKVTDGTYELIEHKATRQPIGAYYPEKPFERIQFEVKPGDMLYMYSDGFGDQFGLPEGQALERLKKKKHDARKNGEKYMPKRMREFFHKHAHLSLDEQHHMRTQELIQRRSGLEQTDDTTVLAVKIPDSRAEIQTQQNSKTPL